MVRINDNFEFEVRTWDTAQSIVNRLAARMNTLPIYLYFPDPIGQKLQSYLENEEDVTIRDILKDFLDLPINEFPKFLKGVDKLDRLDKIRKLNIMKDIISPYIAMNETLEKVNLGMRRSLLLLLKTEITNRVVPAEELWRERKSIRARLKKDIEQNKEHVKELQLLIDIEPKAHTKFNREEASFRIELDFKGLTLLEIFDQLVLTPWIPYATVNNLHKILMDFTPNVKWVAQENVINLRVLQTKPPEPPEYIDVSLELVGDPGAEIGIMKTKLLDFTKGITEQRFKDYLQGVFPGLPLQEKSLAVTKEKGRLFYELGSQPIDSYILGDLALNNPQFNKYLAIDEHETATKKKRSTLYIHFFGDTPMDNVKANITVYKTRRKDEVHSEYGFPIGDYHLNVLISDALNTTAVNNFIMVFGKLLQLYYMRAPEVIKFYRTLLGKSFPPPYKGRAPPVQGIKTKIPLSQIAPEVFVSGYPSRCTHEPRIISEEEAQKAQAAGLQVMLYPKTPDEGFPQRWYVCDRSQKYPYPGLRSNPLPNNDLVPFLPCCFKANQDKEGGEKEGDEKEEEETSRIYGHYFYGKPLTDKSGVSQTKLITRSIFVDTPLFGRLPKELNEMLNLITYKDGWIFVRAGVFDSKSSFLECVLEAILESGENEEIDELLSYSSKEVRSLNRRLKRRIRDNASKKDIDSVQSKLLAAKKVERIELLNKIRDNLTVPGWLASCKQEMYDYSLSEIENILSDPDAYLDPRLFINLFERRFNCNIIIFSKTDIREGQNPKYRSTLKSNMVLPRHVQSYYKTPREGPTILIYEHMGGSSDQKRYPRCELIAHWKAGSDRSDEIHYSHSPDSDITRDMQQLYEKLRRSYALNCPVPETIFPISDLGIKLLGQGIDSYGKCRSLNFSYRGKIGTMLVTPIQPLALPQLENPDSKRLPLHLVKGILKKMPEDSIRETINDYKVTAYSGMLGNVRVSLPFTHEGKKSVIPGEYKLEEDLVAIDQTQSRLSSYIQDKKLSRYITDYARWLYSLFLYNNDLVDSMESMYKFVNKQILVDADFEYGHVSKNFSLDSGVTQKGKLYVKSIETKKRLIYTLQLYANHDPKGMRDYYKRTSITNYYMGAVDFTRRRSQVILQGDDAVSKWIRERNQDYSLHTGVLADKSKTTPYFMKNDLLSDDIVLAQGASNLGDAIAISRVWRRRGYNNSKRINKSEKERSIKRKFTLYSYKNPTDIESYDCDEGCTSGDGELSSNKVLGYLSEENDPEFLSLLPLEECDEF